MAELLAMATAILYGLADFAGGLSTKKLPTWTVVAVSQLFGVPLLLLALIVWPPEIWSLRDFLIGSVGGSFGLIGLSLLYLALGRGTMAVIAPITGVLYLLVGLVVDLIRGEQLGVTQWAGMALAAVAVVLVAGSRGEAAAPPTLLWAAAGAGLGFGALNVIFSYTEATSGLLPLAGARLSSIPIAISIALIKGNRFKLPRATVPAVASAGVLDMAANLTLLTAIHIGVLSVVSAISGVYPAVTAVVALWFLKERLSFRQSVGVVAALLAVGLLAGLFD